MTVTETDRGYVWTCPVCHAHINAEVFGTRDSTKALVQQLAASHSAAGCKPPPTVVRSELGVGPCQADGCKRLDTDIRAVTIDGTHAVMARVALCHAHGHARPLWAVWANPTGQYPTDGPEAA